MSEVDAWENPTTEVTISGLRGLCEGLVKAREVKEEIAASLKKANEDITELEAKILNIMKENALPNFKGEFGTISIKTSKSISQPETMEEKLKFFDYLREIGVFEEMVSVNSRTLSSWASKEIESKESDGIFGWVPPGLKPASEFQSISLRKK